MFKKRNILSAILITSSLNFSPVFATWEEHLEKENEKQALAIAQKIEAAHQHGHTAGLRAAGRAGEGLLAAIHLIDNTANTLPAAQNNLQRAGLEEGESVVNGFYRLNEIATQAEEERDAALNLIAPGLEKIADAAAALQAVGANEDETAVDALGRIEGVSAALNEELATAQANLITLRDERNQALHNVNAMLTPFPQGTTADDAPNLIQTALDNAAQLPDARQAQQAAEDAREEALQNLQDAQADVTRLQEELTEARQNNTGAAEIEDLTNQLTHANNDLENANRRANEAVDAQARIQAQVEELGEQLTATEEQRDEIWNSLRVTNHQEALDTLRILAAHQPASIPEQLTEAGKAQFDLLQTFISIGKNKKIKGMCDTFLQKTKIPYTGGMSTQEKLNAITDYLNDHPEFWHTFTISEIGSLLLPRSN